MSMEYREVCTLEDPEGPIGIRILVSSPCEVPELEVAWGKHAVRYLADGIKRELERTRPGAAELRAQRKTEMIGLFGGRAIYVEEIPNGYCNRACCSQIPWFVVTTSVGRITIGWRKRVIEINWGDSEVETKAEDLFPAEAVTRFDRIVHAWTIEKAREYLDKIIGGSK